MSSSFLTALIQAASSVLPNDPIIEHPKSFSALISNTVDILKGPGLTAGLSCVPKTIYHRWTGESKCPQWSLPEEVIVNIVRALATGDGGNDLTRMFIGIFAGFAAKGCGEPVETVKPLEFPVKGWWIGPPLQDKRDLVLMYIHGGAMVSGNPLQSSPALAILIKKLRERGMPARIFATWYPKAPDAPWPAALEWCTRTYRYLVDIEGYQNVMLIGDSAGGNLTLTTALLLRDRHPSTPQPCGVVPMSPWVDIESKNYAVRNYGVDYLVESPGGGSFQRYYTGHKYQFYKKTKKNGELVLTNLSRVELEKLSAMQREQVQRLQQEDLNRPIHQHPSFPSTQVPDDPEELEKRHVELSRHPLVSPLYASYHSMPPTLIVAGGKELLFDDVLRFYKIAKRHSELSNGATVEWLADPLGIHVYPLLYDIQGERSLRALDHIADWMVKIMEERLLQTEERDREVGELKDKLNQLKNTVPQSRTKTSRPQRDWVIQQQKSRLELEINAREKPMRWQSLGKLDEAPVDLEDVMEGEEGRWEDETFHPDEQFYILDSELLPST